MITDETQSIPVSAPVASTSLATMQAKVNTPKEAGLPAVMAGFESLQGFELAQRIAKVFASSTLVPKNYQGNMADCIVALNMAHRIKADPLMVMQNLYVVQGRPSWSSQFLIATFNGCGRFSAIRYEFVGERGSDQWGCRAYASEKATGDVIMGAVVTIDLAKKEGWYAKNGSKWQTMPEQMLMYRAASWLVRTHAPELAMGIYTREEVEDIGPEIQETTLNSLRASSTALDAVGIDGEAA